MNFTKIVNVGLNFPCQELSNGCLGIIVNLRVRWQIELLCMLRFFDKISKKTPVIFDEKSKNGFGFETEQLQQKC